MLRLLIISLIVLMSLNFASSAHAVGAVECAVRQKFSFDSCMNGGWEQESQCLKQAKRVYEHCINGGAAYGLKAVSCDDAFKNECDANVGENCLAYEVSLQPSVTNYGCPECEAVRANIVFEKDSSVADYFRKTYMRNQYFSGYSECMPNPNADCSIAWSRVLDISTAETIGSAFLNWSDAYTRQAKMQICTTSVKFLNRGEVARKILNIYESLPPFYSIPVVESPVTHIDDLKIPIEDPSVNDVENIIKSLVKHNGDWEQRLTYALVEPRVNGALSAIDIDQNLIDDAVDYMGGFEEVYGNDHCGHYISQQLGDNNCIGRVEGSIRERSGSNFEKTVSFSTGSSRCNLNGSVYLRINFGFNHYLCPSDFIVDGALDESNKATFPFVKRYNDVVDYIFDNGVIHTRNANRLLSYVDEDTEIHTRLSGRIFESGKVISAFTSRLDNTFAGYIGEITRYRSYLEDLQERLNDLTTKNIAARPQFPLVGGPLSPPIPISLDDFEVRFIEHPNGKVSGADK